MQRFELESFETTSRVPQSVTIDHGELEEIKLAAFEKGYSAGWEDAVAAQNAEQARLRADLGQNLQALSFTFHEARQHVLDAMRPLLVDMTAKVLPVVARQTLAQTIAEQVMPLADGLADTPLTVVVNPNSIEQVQELLSQEKSLPLTFVAEETLGEGQVYLRFGGKETHIDLDGVIALIGDAIASYFGAVQKEQKND
ncbi:flagellar biosynthesis protein [Thioclava sp. GXIMD4216]|uniref:Flagellar biosynthesis protein n=1 Tax=Thioclava litoralis TaxID=3076557 RepID=A0ABZ1DVB6_9RHOB|nr:flagellar biosynthesis protein [Thioclava sp. FTW29]